MKYKINYHNMVMILNSFTKFQQKLMSSGDDFARSVAECSLKFFRNEIPPKLKPRKDKEWTVMAAIVLRRSDTDLKVRPAVLQLIIDLLIIGLVGLIIV